MGKSQMIPIRWMAPETLRYAHDIKFSFASDVWAYGITLWEIYTFGELPFFQFNNDEVRLQILKCVTPDIPSTCPLVMKHVMKKCWKFQPSERPLFNEIVSSIEECEIDQDDDTPLLPSIDRETPVGYVAVEALNQNAPAVSTIQMPTYTHTQLNSSTIQQITKTIVILVLLVMLSISIGMTIYFSQNKSLGMFSNKCAFLNRNNFSYPNGY